MNRSKRRLIFECFRRLNPHPETELQFQSPFELLIAVMLSAQATDISVNKVTAKLFPSANTPQAIIAMGEEAFKQIIKSIGLFNSKARHVLQTCHILVNDWQGQVPCERKALESLPGVGRKTANVVLNTAFGQDTVAVDTHIFRVANRTRIAPGKTPLEVEQGILKSVDKEFLHDAHHWLVLHGRYICVARKPKCAVCPILEWCEYKNKNL